MEKLTNFWQGVSFCCTSSQSSNATELFDSKVNFIYYLRLTIECNINEGGREMYSILLTKCRHSQGRSKEWFFCQLAGGGRYGRGELPMKQEKSGSCH